MTRRVLFVNQPIVEGNGTMSVPFQEWQSIVSRAQPFRGSGSPEGVVTAPEDSWYVDEAGSAGSRLYFKALSNISGDASQGWELIG